jgi:hypothetical protein
MAIPSPTPRMASRSLSPSPIMATWAREYPACWASQPAAASLETPRAVIEAKTTPDITGLVASCSSIWGWASSQDLVLLQVGGDLLDQIGTLDAIALEGQLVLAGQLHYLHEDILRQRPAVGWPTGRIEDGCPRFKDMQVGGI